MKNETQAQATEQTTEQKPTKLLRKETLLKLQSSVKAGPRTCTMAARAL